MEKREPSYEELVSVHGRFIPTDIVLEIFNHSSDNDIFQSFGKVCWQWHHLANRKLADLFKLFEYKLISADGRFHTFPEELSQVSVYDELAGSGQSVESSLLVVFDVIKQYKMNLTRSKNLPFSLEKHCSIFKKFDCDAFIKSYHLWSWEFRELGTQDYKFAIYLNTRSLAAMLCNEHVPNGTFLNEYYKELLLYPMSKALDEFLIPISDPIHPKLIYGLCEQPASIKTQLLSYQQYCLSWMLAIEKRAEHKAGFELYEYPHAESMRFVTYDIRTEKFGHCASQDRTTNVVFPGGVLADEVGLGKTLEALSLIMANPQRVDYPSSLRGLKTSKATIVFCPSHVAPEWQHESSKHLIDNLNIVTLITLNDWRTKTVGEFIEADIIIVSHSLLINQNYLNTKVIAPVGAPLTMQNVSLESFHWHRAIVDEGHELLASNCRQQLLNTQATCYWYQSGTPFPNKFIVQQVIRFLHPTPQKRNSIYHLNRHNNVFDTTGGSVASGLEPKFVFINLRNVIMNNLIWRNTKLSVKSEMTIPEYQEDVRVVDFSLMERLRYELKASRYPRNTLHQYCSFSGSENNFYIPSLIKSLEGELYTRPSEALIQKFKYAMSFVEHPSHRLPLETVLSIPKWRRYVYGTKMAALLGFLESLWAKNSKSKVILFSKFPRVLEQVGVVLTNNNIDFTCLTSALNDRHRFEAINRFKTLKETKVILLSLDEGASGTNLQAAHHIVMLDPGSGTKEEMHSTMTQAIGRAHRLGQMKTITVVWFLVRDTIESENYFEHAASLAVMKHEVIPNKNEDSDRLRLANAQVMIIKEERKLKDLLAAGFITTEQFDERKRIIHDTYAPSDKVSKLFGV